MPQDNYVRRTIWISDDLWERMAAAAALDGRSISSWVRSRAELALSREIRKVVTPATPK